MDDVKPTQEHDSCASCKRSLDGAPHTRLTHDSGIYDLCSQACVVDLVTKLQRRFAESYFDSRATGACGDNLTALGTPKARWP